MSISIKINTTGLETQLNKIAQALQNREPLMRNLSEQLHDCVMENFDQEGRPAWAKIARDGKILQDSGRLKASITPDYDNNTAKTGTNLVYARIQNDGGTTRPHKIYPKRAKALKFGNRFAKSVDHPGSTITARPFLSVTDEDIAGFKETIEDYFNRMIESEIK